VIDTSILSTGREDLVHFVPSLSILVVIYVFFLKQQKYHRSDCGLSVDAEWILFLSLKTKRPTHIQQHTHTHKDRHTYDIQRQNLWDMNLEIINQTKEYLC
jgi:hypothetical protein